MEQEVKVSVWCLTCNHEKFIADALEGFVSQKCGFDFEVLVHDDASADATPEIIGNYARRWPRLIRPVLQKENLWSRGVDIMGTVLAPLSSGEYIAVCDGDDFWTDPDKLRLQAEFLDAHPEYSACAHNSVMHHLPDGTERIMYPTGDRDVDFDQVIRRGGAGFHFSSLMFRRSAWNDRPEYLSGSEGYGDYPLSIHLALSGRIRFIDRQMSVYRFGSPGSWTARNMADVRRAVEHCRSVIALLEKVNAHTGGAHSQTISRVVLENEYTIAETQMDYSALRKEPLGEIYRSRPLSYRTGTRLKQAAKPLYALYRKIRYRG